jgi:predicted nicotinamide N-methyase
MVRILSCPFTLRIADLNLPFSRQACIALSNHLIASPSALSSSDNILELGAGVGLLSLVAARLLSREGAAEQVKLKRVVATDVDEKVLEMLEGNVENSAYTFRLC